MNIHQIFQKDKQYPRQLIERMGAGAPASLYTSGNVDILLNSGLGLICSVSCPGSIVIQTFDAILDLRAKPMALIGGFHSPMERDCLDIWLHGSQPVIFCPAKSLRNLAMGKAARTALAEGQLLILTPFGDGVRRTTAAQALFRNDMVAALSDMIFVPYASSHGKTWAAVQKASRRHQTILSFDDEANYDLIEFGVKVFKNGQIESFFQQNL
jgi:predicted Rossmann fold nucleotide-binding protein DprA/Smf involved in DNA uptake